VLSRKPSRSPGDGSPDQHCEMSGSSETSVALKPLGIFGRSSSSTALQFGQGTPARPQPQEPGPSQGRSRCRTIPTRRSRSASTLQEARMQFSCKPRSRFGRGLHTCKILRSVSNRPRQLNDRVTFSATLCRCVIQAHPSRSCPHCAITEQRTRTRNSNP
jgi:hypothetical protein